MAEVSIIVRLLLGFITIKEQGLLPPITNPQVTVHQSAQPLVQVCQQEEPTLGQNINQTITARSKGASVLRPLVTHIHPGKL